MPDSGTPLHSHHWSAILPVAARVYDWAEADFLTLLRLTAQQVGFTVVGELAVPFQPQGVSALVLLAESHVALHFWPEQGKVTVDIHVCDYHHCNQARAAQLAQYLTHQLTDGESGDRWHHLSTTG